MVSDIFKYTNKGSYWTSSDEDGELKAFEGSLPGAYFINLWGGQDDSPNSLDAFKQIEEATSKGKKSVMAKTFKASFLCVSQAE